MMAVAAQSRVAPLASVSEPETDLAAFTVNGAQVLVDLRDLSCGYGETAVVVSHDGAIEIISGPLEKDGPAWLNARTVVGPWIKVYTNSAGGARSERHYYTMIGRVIEPGEKRRRFA